MVLLVAGGVLTGDIDRQVDKDSNIVSRKEETKTALVIFQPSGRRGRFPIGMPVLQAARKLGVYLESVCGGRGLCGRCQIIVTTGTFAKYGITSRDAHLSPIEKHENDYRSKKFLGEDRRLGCSALIFGDLVVNIPSEARSNRQLIRKRAEHRKIERDLVTHLRYVELPEPDILLPIGDTNRLINVLEKDWGYSSLSIDPSLLPSVQSIVRKGDWKVTAAVFEEQNGPPIVTGLWPGLKERIYGLSIDIGSTTIASHLCDLTTGRVVSSSGALNPQIRFGEDLMSRISYIQMNPGSESELTDEVRNAIDELIIKTSKEARIALADILEAIIVGNPIMHHLFLGINPSELGGAPFTLAVSSAISFPVGDIIPSLPPTSRLHLLPCIAGHVGADAAAVMLSERPYKKEDNILIVDIGTNAEIIFGNNKRLLAASSPTGPAFEGAEISCGQRAAPGAIERVRIDPQTFEPIFKVIGIDHWSNETEFAEQIERIGVTGICGSGIVEVIAEMFLKNIVSSDGVINCPCKKAEQYLVKVDRTYKYIIYNGELEISVSQKDVRAIQLAKAALYAGVRLLMDKINVDEVSKIRLAGAFGSYIDPKYAMILGLIPDCDLGKVSSIGNAASTGARMALLNRKFRHEIQEEVEKIEKVETAMETRFQEHFINAMAFPNKVEKFPLLRSKVSLPAPSAEDNVRRGSRKRRRRM